MNECKILLVDDDPEDHVIMKEAMETVITEPGFIQFTTSGVKALELLAACPVADKLPRLVVLDLNMPILSGTETLSRLKKDKRLQHIPIIIFSTSANPIEKEKCINLGAYSYLIKPHTYQQIVEMAKYFLQFCSTA